MSFNGIGGKYGWGGLGRGFAIRYIDSTPVGRLLQAGRHLHLVFLHNIGDSDCLGFRL